ncbi:hypothetical protein I5M27_13205 [Adhaeribacter sp. BT258]|uniref:Uncharacterized protein n=1 Tax=Adhaeribacter terrigena TaxID=2793070 RepID=A0ABS1C3G1_9BACT|nr:hypothetical protein [Adhaeribacter terrigena]MBK0403946.1 hypothetical protein [Adhaeribacter terrigena]
MKLLQRILKQKKNLDLPVSHDEVYYLLECWNQYADLPESLLPYVDLIKTKAEWEKLGFVLEMNKYGQIRKFKVENKYFSFIKVDGQQAAEAKAIRLGKRLTHNPEYIALLIARGCQPEEFLHNLPGE